MKDPIELPYKSLHRFICINLVNGHVRKEKIMTAGMADRINSYNHTRESGYMWLYNDQYDFNDELQDDARLVPQA